MSDGYEPLFNGRDLSGWSAVPRCYGTLWPNGPAVQDVVADFPADYDVEAERNVATWTVEDGVVVGRQNPPGSGYGGYLVSQETFGDFDLLVDIKPDWPADTGVMIRRLRSSWNGLQVLIDHRHSGSIGGFFGNGIGMFHAVPFATTAARDEDGRPIGLVVDDPERSAEPFSPEKAALLTYGAGVDDFLQCWRWADWNTLRIRCVGARPVVTTWINDVKIAEINLATLTAHNYDADAVSELLGDRGHLALEVHDNDPILGQDRWGPHAACRWRNARIKRL